MDSMSPASFASLSSLLTPSESHAFHSFLSTMNPPPPHQDWIDVDVPKDRQALAKATKDLMSLDTQYAHNNDHLFNTLPTSASHYSQVLLPHPPPSDSSSRTPTPTSVPPFSFHQPPSGRQSSRTRASHSHPYPISPVPKQRRSSQSQPQASSSAPPKPQPQKPALLTASQKKANHIQSEQKRRANIRRGYEALCECVPALREAIREEEEALAAANDGNTSRNGVATAKRKGKMAVKGKDGEEKVDGRAGPRSENVVLSKTIDYINELLDERNTLLARLHSARSTLPPGHPALVPAHYSSTYSGPGHEREGGGEESGPLWEREWKGGHGTLGNTCEAGGDESS